MELVAKRYGIEPSMLKDLQTIVNWMDETAWKNRQATFDKLNLDELRMLFHMSMHENPKEMNAEEIPTVLEKNEQLVGRSLVFYILEQTTRWPDPKQLPVSDAI